jgi:hypothetical protein
MVGRHRAANTTKTLARRLEIQLLTVRALENQYSAGLGYALYRRHERHGLLAFGALGKIGRPGWWIWVQRENARQEDTTAGNSASSGILRMRLHDKGSPCAGTHAVRGRFAPMKKIEDYHAHAAECRSMADRARSPRQGDAHEHGGDVGVARC